VVSGKKLLLVYDVSYPHVEGGGQRRMYEVASRMKAQGYDVDWLCFQTWDGDPSFTDKSGIRYIGLPGYRGLYREDGSRRGREPVEFLMALLRSGFRFKDYDIIWSGQWPMLHLAWWMLFPSVLGRAKLVVDWWEIWGSTWFSYSRKFGLIGFLLEKFLIHRLPKAGTVVFIAPRAYVQARQMNPQGRLALIHNGIDLSAIKSALPDPDWASDIVYLGRLKDHKRVDLLLLALERLNIEHNCRVTACIVGDGPEMAALKEMTASLGLTGQVKFAGAVASNNTVYEILLSSKIFVNPSVKEGGGSITLFEAFACGLPVVAFDCKDGIDPLLVGDEVSGKLVKNVTAAALSEAINGLLVNPGRLEELRNGALSASLRHDWNAIAQDYEVQFNESKPSEP